MFGPNIHSEHTQNETAPEPKARKAVCVLPYLNGRYRIRTCDLLGVKPDEQVPAFTVFGVK